MTNDWYKEWVLSQMNIVNKEWGGMENHDGIAPYRQSWIKGWMELVGGRRGIINEKSEDIKLWGEIAVLASQTLEEANNA